jgi:hypothetical protein
MHVPFMDEKEVSKDIQNFNITLVPTNKYNIKNLINANYKGKEPYLKKSGIYQINCKQYDKMYIGQTKRNLEMRTKRTY